jgi:Flp pilus assembly protein TadD
MSKKVIAAAVAALSLSACTEHPRPRPAAAPVIAPKAVVPPRDSGPGEPLPTAGAAPTGDAGLVDRLALEHDTPTVDHLGRAEQLALEGDVKGGLTEARRALFTAPDDEETLTRVAQLARRAGQPALAAEAWERVAMLEPTDAQPLIARGRALLGARDFAGAVLAGRGAAARDEGDPEAWQVTGLAQLGLGELGGAIASFEKAVELSPQHGWALNNLGFACLRASQNERAVEVLERAAALLPQVAYVQNNLGVALERVGRADEAKAAYLHAMDLSPKYVKARLNAARVAKAPTGERLAEPDEAPIDAHPLP